MSAIQTAKRIATSVATLVIVFVAAASIVRSDTLPLTPKKPRAPRVVTVVARNYAFDAPDTIAAGRTELQLINRGTELHHAYLLRLDAGKHLSDLIAAFQAGGPPPAWVHDAGGPNSRAPGETSAAVVDLQPGTYAMICVIPSADGMPHIMKGMSHEFTVVAEPRAVAERATASAIVDRAPDVTITLSDYAFDVSGKLASGHHVVRVRNAAAQSHELFVGRLAPGKTAADVVAWVEKQQGPPPAQPLGGRVGLARGTSNDIALDLTPGEYAFFCFIPDAKDGKPHVMHGMVKSFTVR